MPRPEGHAAGTGGFRPTDLDPDERRALREANELDRRGHDSAFERFGR